MDAIGSQRLITPPATAPLRPPADIEDSYVVSPLQEGMLFHSLYAPHHPMYVRQIILSLREIVDVPVLRSAWERVFNRHPILRSSLRWKGISEPVQEIHATLELPFDQQDWRAFPIGEHDERLRDFLVDEKHTGFELSKAPLMRVRVLRLADADFRMVWTFHHILSDGYSDVLTIRELFTFYDSFCRGQDLHLEDPPSYGEHCKWLRQQDCSQAEEYWREKLKGFTEPTPLGMGAAFGSEEDSGAELGEQSLKLPADLTAKLKSLARAHELTLSTMLHGAWALLLSTYSGGQADVVFGGVRGCRRSSLDGMGGTSIVGPFINTLPLRVSVSPDSILLSWLKELRQQWVDLRDYEHTPLVKVLDCSELSRGIPLFESAVAYDKAQMNTVLHAQGTLVWRNRELRTVQARSNYPLTLAAYGEDEFLITVRYDESRFEGPNIVFMLERLRYVFERIAENIEQKLSNIRLLTADEKRRLLYEWNETGSDYPREGTVAGLFEEQVKERAEATAVVFGAERVSYEELNERANRLARHLRSLGVGREELVGICVERSTEMVVSLLGILKAGGAYLPLDAGNPGERLASIMSEGQVRVLLVQEKFKELFAAESGVRVVSVDSDWGAVAQYPAENLEEVGVEAEQLAYAMFTSGSTGVPNGVCVTQRSVVRLVKETNYVELGEEEVLLQLAPLSFDASTFEIWGCLLNGGRLVVMPPGAPTLEELGAALKEHGVTTLWLTAGLFHLMVEQGLGDLSGLRQLLAGGDVLSVSHVKKFLERAGSTKLINGYGPTENTTFTCCHVMAAGDDLKQTVPIGRPIANTRVYLLDEQLEPVPVGVNGELYISGDGLARCYLKRPELTAEKFIPDPFSRSGGERLYRSGDTARYRPDGVLEFVGRRDNQVKVRGFRIELGEIEAALGSHAEVGDAVVIARAGKSGGEKQVVAYVVLRGERLEGLTGELRSYLRSKLPEYMVPAAFVMMAQLPLTANGKIDRRALPEPAAENTEAAATYVGPRNEMEELVAGVWQQVLGLERVGIYDNFFDLGGHSLLATQVMSRLRESLGVDIALRTVFDTPTVAALAECIAARTIEGAGVNRSPIARVSREAPLPLSFEQQRLWFFDQLMPRNPFYNLPVAYGITGRLNVEALEHSITRIVERHEMLRTVFTMVDGLPAQQVQPASPVNLELVRIGGADKGGREAEVENLVRKEGQRPFDLSRGPLLRAILFEVTKSEHVLVVTIHHIAADGWSMEVFLRELAALYEARLHGELPSLPELTVQYADYAVWQRRTLADDGVQQQLEYWKRQLADAPSSLNLPTDYSRPPAFSFRGAFEHLEIDGDLFRFLGELCRQSGVTLFMTLLSAFAALLARYSGEKDILIGAPIANRSRVEVERLIGFFTNTLVLRIDMSGNPPFRELLSRVREVSLGAYAHQEVPFEKLVEELHPERDLSRNPLFQVAFSIQNKSDQALQLADITIEPSNVDIETSKFDLCLYVCPSESTASGWIGYNRDLFNPETIERMCRHFVRLLRSIAARPDARLSELEMLLEEEKALLGRTSDIKDFEKSFSL